LPRGTTPQTLPRNSTHLPAPLNGPASGRPSRLFSIVIPGAERDRLAAQAEITRLERRPAARPRSG